MCNDRRTRVVVKSVAIPFIVDGGLIVGLFRESMTYDES